MKFTLACGDVLPGCSSRFESGSKDELFGEVAAHAAAEHEITEITPDLRRLVETRMAASA